MTVQIHILPPRYRGPERIGHGGMGDIYSATDSVLGRVVAIKVLADRYAQDESVRERFTREALAAARLSGEPNTVTIFDVGEHNGRPYIVMEYLGGGSLDDILRAEGARPPEQVFTWLEEAARALDVAHREGVVHRDVKPANLLLDAEGHVHVADFGIASAAGMHSLTMTGTVLGTAGYLSPEQARGERAGPASDRYALAIVAWELLTGRRPFESESPTAEAAAHVNAPIPSVCERSRLPCELDPVFTKALAKDPAERYGTADEFVAALRGAFADAAGPTRAQPILVPAPPPTEATRSLHRDRSVGYPPVRSRGAWPLLAALLLLGAVGGAVLAYALDPRRRRVSHGGHPCATGDDAGSDHDGREAGHGHDGGCIDFSGPASAPSSGASGAALNDAGFRKMQAGDYAGALPLLERAVQRLQGTNSLDEAYADYNLASTRVHLGSCDGVLELLDRSESIQGQRDPIDRLREQC